MSQRVFTARLSAASQVHQRQGTLPYKYSTSCQRGPPTGELPSTERSRGVSQQCSSGPLIRSQEELTGAVPSSIDSRHTRENHPSVMANPIVCISVPVRQSDSALRFSCNRGNEWPRKGQEACLADALRARRAAAPCSQRAATSGARPSPPQPCTRHT